MINCDFCNRLILDTHACIDYVVHSVYDAECNKREANGKCTKCGVNDVNTDDANINGSTCVNCESNGLGYKGYDELPLLLNAYD